MKNNSSWNDQKKDRNSVQTRTTKQVNIKWFTLDFAAALSVGAMIVVLFSSRWIGGPARYLSAVNTLQFVPIGW